MKKGFIKIDRKIQANWLWGEKPYSKGQAWIDMLLRANWADGRIKHNGEFVAVKRGQLYKSEVELAKTWGWSRGKVRRFVNVLVHERMVVQHTVQGISLFSICNFEKYQSDGTGNGTGVGTAHGTAHGTHNKNNKEEVKNNTTNVVLAKPEYGKPEINEVFAYWENAVGYAITSRITANRHAAANLTKKYGADGLGKLIRGVAASQNDQYAPRISDFVSLQSKTNDLLAWLKKTTTKKGITVIS